MFPAPLREFVRHFNDAEYWESHEVLEDAWRTDRSEFYHGLILYASALVHVQRANVHGVQAQLRKAVRCLAAYGPHYLGVDVAPLLTRARAVLDGKVDWVGADPDAFPVIRLDPALLSGDEPELAAGRHAGPAGARPHRRPGR